MEASENEIPGNSGGKPMMGVRLPAITKKEVGDEAGAKGMTMSEYVENILQTRHDGDKEIARLKELLKQEQLKVEEQKSELARFKARHFDTTEAHKQSITKLQSEIAELKAVADLLMDERLLQLFSEVKGRKDEIENAKGKNFSIIYQKPLDLLKAMIYSFKLKKP